MNVNFLEELFLESVDDQIRQARNIIKQKYKDYPSERVEEILQNLLSLTEPYQDKSVPRNKPATNQAHLPKLTKFHIRGNINLNSLQDYYTRYMNIPTISTKSIERFQDFHAFEREVDAHFVADENAKTEEIDEPPIYSDSKIDVFLGNSMDKCIKYGQGETYGLCISRKTKSKNYYAHYRIKDKLTTYFVYFKNRVQNAPTGFIIVDATEDPEIFSYNIITPNSDQEISKDSLLKKFPDLQDAITKNVFAENPLTEEEIERERFVEEFEKYQGLSTFVNAPKDFKILALKSVLNLADDIYEYLEENNYWDLINEFVSSGPNLTSLQADSIEKKGGSVLNYYLRKRDMSLSDLLSSREYRFNKLDNSVPTFQIRLKEVYENIYNQIKEGEDSGNINISLKNISVLIELPSNFPKIVQSLTIDNCGLLSLKNCPEIVQGDFDCSYNKLTSLKGAPKNVGGNFICTNNHQLTSLEGAPENVKGNFSCYDNHELTSLKGAPKNVGGNFICRNNYQLTSLEGAPKSVGRNFYCSSCNLTSLKGAPKNVGGDFFCSNNKLISLKGAPENVKGNFSCDNNYQLTSLEGAPKSVGGNFSCMDNYQLTSLKGAPENVKGNFICSSNKLSSLEGAPEIVGGDFNCSNNKLTSLKGSPEIVKKDFYCGKCSLITLKFGPKFVKGNFDCASNRLVTLEGSPKTVIGNFDCSDNPYLMSLKGSPLLIGKNLYLYYTPKLDSLEGIAESIGGSVHLGNRWLFRDENIKNEMEKSKKRNSLRSESFKYFFYNQ